MTSCKKTTCLISVIAVSLFMLVFEHFFHGCPWMTEMYQKTASLWRSQEDMKQYLPLIIARSIVLAGIITCLYKKCTAKTMDAGTTCGTTGEPKKCCPYQKGLCFGLKIGVFIGVLKGSAYAYMPIPSELALAWLIGSIVEGLGIGLVLAIICTQMNKGECTAK